MEFNKKKIYNEQVAPIVTELKNVCTKNGIPVFITSCVADGQKGCQYESDMVSPTMLKLDLTDDHYPKHLAVLNGFEVAPFKKEVEELEIPII